MPRPNRVDRDVDPGPVQIQPRQVHFDFSDIPLHWIPGHPVASDVIGLLNVALPAIERWIVATFNEALPLVDDPRLADEMRGFIGQESIHADTHEQALHDFMVGKGLDPKTLLRDVDYLFGKLLRPPASANPTRRYNQLRDRLWLIAAFEHYTAVLGDFALNSSWDDYRADPTLADLFRWHGAEEVEHRHVAHDVATYFSDSYWHRIGAMALAVSFLAVSFQRGAAYLIKKDPEVDIGWWRLQRMRYLDARAGLLPRYRTLFITNTLDYLRPGFTPDDLGSTAQAVAYLARSPAARAAHL
ncbi:MAG TPA: metal-dependent hydrolase [Mycobacterium sp.]|nr:metal-dependent hydrolase [Mycobacterium sp.]